MRSTARTISSRCEYGKHHGFAGRRQAGPVDGRVRIEHVARPRRSRAARPRGPRSCPSRRAPTRGGPPPRTSFFQSRGSRIPPNGARRSRMPVERDRAGGVELAAPLHGPRHRNADQSGDERDDVDQVARREAGLGARAAEEQQKRRKQEGDQAERDERAVPADEEHEPGRHRGDEEARPDPAAAGRCREGAPELSPGVGRRGDRPPPRPARRRSGRPGAGRRPRRGSSPPRPRASGCAGRKGRPRQSQSATAASATTRNAPYGWIAGRSQAAPAAANAQRPVRFSLATTKRSIASAAAKTYSVYIRANVP